MFALILHLGRHIEHMEGSACLNVLLVMNLMMISLGIITAKFLRKNLSLFTITRISIITLLPRNAAMAIFSIPNSHYVPLAKIQAVTNAPQNLNVHHAGLVTTF